MNLIALTTAAQDPALLTAAATTTAALIAQHAEPVRRAVSAAVAPLRPLWWPLMAPPAHGLSGGPGRLPPLPAQQLAGGTLAAIKRGDHGDCSGVESKGHLGGAGGAEADEASLPAAPAAAREAAGAGAGTGGDQAFLEAETAATDAPSSVVPSSRVSSETGQGAAELLDLTDDGVASSAFHRTSPTDPLGEATRIVHSRYEVPGEGFVGVSAPLVRGSTRIFSSAADYNCRDHFDNTTFPYGTSGTDTTRALEHRIAEIEGGHKAVLAPSGLGAITTALFAFLSAGDHLLLVDASYGPTRKFCDEVLSRMGIETTCFDPMSGGDIAQAMRTNTRMVWLEAPCSITFEVPDVPAIAAAAHAHGALLGVDNTWSAGLYFKPFEHGADISVQALTKYQAGSGNVLMGAIIAPNEELWRPVRHFSLRMGNCVSPDDAWRITDNLAYLPMRMRNAQTVALDLARQLAQGEHPQVARVLHPALPSCPGHEFWKRDFTGSSGVFSIVLDPRYTIDDVDRMLQGMRVFSIGNSWGGPKSLALPYCLSDARMDRLGGQGIVLRFSVGAEDPADLQRDIERGLSLLGQPGS